ncbi:MAG: phosphoglycerate kinase, partial [Thermovirgaceae bacterium]|nr:phosphoglycerate kinase [Thermovirgaceae bacterium]
PFDMFVMDAFSTSHRAHASTQGVTAFLPSFAGKVMEREVSILGSVREFPKEPMVLILGGAKVSEKIRIIRYMLKKLSHILIGGAMAFPFLKASGYGIGRSFCEEGTERTATALLVAAKRAGVEVVLPVDVVVSDSPSNGSGAFSVKAGEIPAGFMGLDIGPETVDLFSKALGKANTILWNGPLGVFETSPFEEGTRLIGEAVSRRTSEGAVTVLGGGDTAAAANSLGFSGGIFHISTGGGATLEFFEGLDLPGITPLLVG